MLWTICLNKFTPSTDKDVSNVPKSFRFNLSRIEFFNPSQFKKRLFIENVPLLYSHNFKANFKN